MAGVVTAATKTKDAAVAGANYTKDKAVEFEAKHDLAAKTKLGAAAAITKTKEVAIAGASYSKAKAQQVDEHFKVSEKVVAAGSSAKATAGGYVTKARYFSRFFRCSNKGRLPILHFCKLLRV